MLGNLFGMNKQSNKSKFTRVLDKAKFGLTADVVCQPSDWRKIGEYSVPAQHLATFGANDPVGGGSVAGQPVYLRIDDTSGQLQGVIRFALNNNAETNQVIVMEERTERLSADTTNDRTKSVLLPEYPAKAKEDSKLQILFYPDSSSAVTIDFDDADTAIRVPVTIYQ